jgi:hypothetical protein
MNTKMKTLSLAVLGLVGFAAAGSAMAGTCPSSLVPPWSSTSSLGGSLSSVAGGLDGSACKLATSITLNGPGVNAFVRDNTPANEQRYRAQFIVNADALGAVNSIQSVKVLGASTDAPANGVSDNVRLTLFGNISGTTKVLGVFTVCAGQPGNLCSATANLVAGNNTVEIDWVKGAAGTLKVWVNNNVEGTPTVSLTGNDSSAWGGVDFATLGLSTPSSGFRSAHLNQVVNFDRFDSRRQTFIGF